MYIQIGFVIYMIIEITIVVIKQKRSSSCEGKIIKNNLHDDFETKRFVYLIEYIDNDGKKYLLKSRITNGGKTNNVGNTVKLLKYNFNRKLRVQEPISLYFSPIIRIVLTGIFVLGFIYW